MHEEEKISDNGDIVDDVQREEWMQQQITLKSRLIETDDISFSTDNEFTGLRYIGGVDLSFVKDNNNDAIASLVVLTYPALEILYTDYQKVSLDYPYIAGFLAFREVAPLLSLITSLQSKQPSIFPQFIIVDGNGTLHPRQFGLACHLGVLADVPTIGVGKNFLQIDDGVELSMPHVKKVTKDVLKKGGDVYYLKGQSGTVYGAAVRSLDTTTNPIFVSVGHRISLDTAIRLVLRCCKYRIPEPTRQADICSREFIRTQNLEKRQSSS
ncbi:10367_t:CDS:2 [Paraglomus occultum]|uniref:10367_t:CDS:1 n=1 Tax=Paraglomus occultum TaxID=144539 RepID=A0A9N9B3Z6_9GLOM|nr:10367_t:CDS:2 [Paraglomus occultum]